MRILHTSDWHLGRSFLGVGMLPYQARFLDHLVQVVESESVDVVLVSGDVYDRALPPLDAVELFQDALERLADSRATTVITSGNHDSALRLGFASRLIDRSGVHLRTHPREVGMPIVIPDEFGPVAVHGLPYLDPDHLRQPWQLPRAGHEATLREAMNRVGAAESAAGSPRRSVVMAHAFVADVAQSRDGTDGEGEPEPRPSDSERDISIGGVQLVPASVFAGVDYVALGHLHGRHVLTEQIRYCGSPLAYSFSEAGHRKGSWLVDLDARGFAGARFVDAPVPRPLVRLRGEIEDLLTSPSHAAAEAAWVQAVLTDPTRPARAKPRLEQRFPHLLSLHFDPRGEAAGPIAADPVRPGTSDHDVTLDFVRDVRGRPADASESALLRRATERVRHDPEANGQVSA